MAVGAAIEVVGLPWARDAARGVTVVGTLWTNALMMTVAPLVIAAIIPALGALRNARVVLRISAMTVLVFALLLTLAAGVTVLASRSVLSLVSIDGWPGLSALQRTAGLGAATTQLPPFSRWLINLVPGNPVRSAIDGSLVQIFVFAAALGAAITVVSAESRSVLLRFFGNVTETMMRLVQLVMRAAPVALFVLALPLGQRLGVTAVGAAGVFGLAVTVSSAAVILLLYPVAAWLGGVGLLQFGRACAEAQLIAATTRTSAAPVPALFRGAEGQLKIAPPVSRSVVPLGAGLFQLGTVIIQTAALLTLAHFYKVQLAPIELGTMVLISSFVSLNIPGVPGGATIALMPALFAMSIPAEALGIVLVVEAVAGTLSSVASATGQMAAACIVARHVVPEWDERYEPSAIPAT
jgi:Na+/H+-dicarboxylate symporter